MIKIYIDPGHGGNDPGAVANGLQEKNIVLDLGLRIRDILAHEYEGIAVKMSRSKDATLSLKARTDDANSWGADYFLSIHINAGGGEGFETFIFPKAGGETKAAQKAIHSAIMKRIGGKDRGMKEANYHVLRESNMKAILTENLFIDSAKDAARLKDAYFLESLARGHVEGLESALGLKRRQEPKETAQKTKDGPIYRVQVGAFREPENAQKLAAELQAKGYAIHIVKD